MSRLAWILLATAVVQPVTAEGTLRVAGFSRDVASLDPLSPAFDPDSYSVITQIFDPLVYFDLEGGLRPGLATFWKRTSPTTWEFTLRRGVRFHNGEPFDARSVKFTFDYLLDPTHRAGNAWVFSTLERVELVDGDPYRVVFHTRYPDGMFLARHSMFGSICPPGYFARVGADGFADKPVGTGPFRLTQRESGRLIELEANPDYWQDGVPSVDRLRFEIIPAERWLEAFLAGEIDLLPHLPGNRTSELMERAAGRARILKRLTLSGYQVMIRNSGPLADVRVRRALNHAVNREALVRYADYGNAVALASLGKIGEFGANETLKPFSYDPELARRLLAEAGVERPLRLKAIAAEIASPVARIIAHDLSRIGVIVELKIVSRAAWAELVVGHKLRLDRPADYDLAISLVDNPIHNLAFHAGLFLHSKSPWSLTDSPEYDARYIEALRTVEPAEHRRRLEELDRFIHDQALMIFTTQRIITAAVSERVDIPKISSSGHLDYVVLSTATISEQSKEASP